MIERQEARASCRSCAPATACSTACSRSCPRARVGHVGLYRDPATLVRGRVLLQGARRHRATALVIVVDPMLATGNSAVAARQPAEGGAARVTIRVRVPARPRRRASQRLHARHPDVPIFTAAVDDAPQRPRLHRPGSGRRRRSTVRHAVAATRLLGVTGGLPPGFVSRDSSGQGCRLRRARRLEARRRQRLPPRLRRICRCEQGTESSGPRIAAVRTQNPIKCRASAGHSATGAPRTALGGESTLPAVPLRKDGPMNVCTNSEKKIE